MNYIKEYHKRIQKGEITVGKWIQAVYCFLAERLDGEAYRFDQKAADKVIRFIEGFCRHCEGREDLIRLELWQKAALSAMFGILDEAGRRVFREVFIVVARKNGKSLFASAVMAYMAYLDGEYGARIYCLAPKLDQASIVFSNFHKMIEKDAELAALHHKRRNDIYIKQTNTTIRPLAFNAKKSDGFNPHLVVNDELASWRGDGGLKQYSVMKSALGARRQPMILNISTAGYENNGIYDELMMRSTAVLTGASDERRLLPLLYTIDDPDKWDDLQELKKANPNLGVSVSEEFYLDEITAAHVSLPTKVEFLVKYCNLKQNSSTAWLEYRLVERALCRGITLRDFSGCYAVGGFDLSQSTDLTAAAIVVQRGGKLYAFVQFFMPRERLSAAIAADGVPYDIFVQKGILTLSGDNYVDYSDVYRWFVALREQYDFYILKIGYDPYCAQGLVNDLTNNAGMSLDYVKQGENLSPVIREFEGILKDGDFFIADNGLLQAHFLNVALKQNLENRKAAAVKIEPRARIDGFVAVIDAMTVRQKWWSEIGEYLKNEST